MQLASADARSSRRAFPSYHSSSSTASSRRPSSISASTWSATNLIAAGSTMPSRRTETREQSDGCVRSVERKLEMAERSRCHELGRAAASFGHEVQRAECRRPGRVRSPAMRLDEALEGEVVRQEGLLTGLLCRLLPLEARASALEITEGAFDLAEKDENIRRGALVAELVRALQQLDECVMGCGERVRPPPVDRGLKERLRQNPAVRRGLPKSKRSGDGGHRALAPKKRLRHEPRAKRLRGESLVP